MIKKKHELLEKQGRNYATMKKELIKTLQVLGINRFQIDIILPVIEKYHTNNKHNLRSYMKKK